MRRHTTIHPAGFTIVELLVVITIIMLLISLLLPSLSTAREQGRATQCRSNLHQLTTAEATYGEDYRGVVPPMFFGYYDASASRFWGTGFGAQIVMLPYLNAEDAWAQVVKSKGTTLGNISCTTGTSPGIKVGVLICPSEAALGNTFSGKFTGDRYSYSVNGLLCSTAAGGTIAATNSYYTSTTLHHASRTIFMADRHVPIVGNYAQAHWNFAWFDVLDNNYVNAHPSEDGYFSMHPAIGRNAGFLDGHVEWLSHGTVTRPIYDPLAQ